MSKNKKRNKNKRNAAERSAYLRGEQSEQSFINDCDSLELNLCLLASITVPSMFELFIKNTESKARENGFAELRGRKYSEKVVNTVIERVKSISSSQ